MWCGKGIFNLDNARDINIFQKKQNYLKKSKYLAPETNLV